jgi:hypothetical protein
VNELPWTLSKIPQAVSNEEIADYLTKATAFVRGPAPADGKPILRFTRWDSPILLKVVDEKDHDLPLDAWPGLEVAEWVSTIQFSVNVDIRIVSGSDAGANAAILVAPARTFKGGDGGVLRVRHDNQEILLTPREALGGAPTLHESLGPPLIYCGKRIFGESVKAFAVIFGSHDNDPATNQSDFSRYIAECLGVGLGLRSYVGGPRAIEDFANADPVPFLSLIYSLDLEPGTLSDVFRAKVLAALSTLRPN